MVAAMTKPSQPRSTNISSSLSAISFGPPTIASWTWPRPEIGDEVERARVGLAGGLQHAVADAEDALHALELFGGDRLVERLGGKVEIQRFRQQRQRVDLQRQLR